MVSVDQRGHGSSDTPVDANFSIEQAADDAWCVVEALGWERVIIVGHSWGASVAVRAAAQQPTRVAGLGLVDGGLWSMSRLGDRTLVRQSLTPPRVSIAPDELGSLIEAGALGPWATDETIDALRPTFAEADDGLLTTAIGFDRHMAVLDGLLDYDAEADLQTLAGEGLHGLLCAMSEHPVRGRGCAIRPVLVLPREAFRSSTDGPVPSTTYPCSGRHWSLAGSTR